jgi:hypothetical protein
VFVSAIRLERQAGTSATAIRSTGMRVRMTRL